MGLLQGERYRQGMPSLKLQAVTKIDPSGIEISDSLGGAERPCNKLMGMCIFMTRTNIIFDRVVFLTQ